MLYTEQAIVLRTYNLGEADRIVVMLTRERGIVRAVGKGVRRTKSRFGSRLEPGMVTKIQCFEGRNLDTVTQAVSVHGYGAKIAADFDRYAAMSVLLEVAQQLVAEGEPQLQQYLLLEGALRSLTLGAHPMTLVVDAYLLRAIAVAGWAPSFSDCARCGLAGPHRAFNIAAGGSVCPQCRPPGSAAPSPGTLELMAALLTGDWVYADASDLVDRRAASGLVSAYVQWHLERGVRSMGQFDRSLAALTRYQELV